MNKKRNNYNHKRKRERPSTENKEHRTQRSVHPRDFNYSVTPIYRFYSHHLKSHLNTDEIENMFKLMNVKLPSCFRFRVFDEHQSTSHNTLSKMLRDSVKQINHEIIKIKNGDYNKFLTLDSETLEALKPCDPILFNIAELKLQAMSMTDLSKADLRKAKRFKLKESEGLENKLEESDLLGNVPIFGLMSKFQKDLTLLNEYGIISRQELVSMIPPLFLRVQPTDFVLDMCAAPGSKTKQLSEMLGPKGLLVANEIDNKRTYTLTHNMKSGLGEYLLGNTIVISHAAQQLPELRFKIDTSCEKYADMTERSVNNKADYMLRYTKILCDVPCSGDGAIRKIPNKWRDFKARDGYTLNPLQFVIADKGLKLLQSGGILSYSTCSINPIENEAVVARLLKENPDVELVDVWNAQEYKEIFNLLTCTKGMTNWDVLKSKRMDSVKEKDPEYMHDENAEEKVENSEIKENREDNKPKHDTEYELINYETFVKVQSGTIENYSNLKETMYIKDYQFADYYDKDILNALSRSVRVYPHQNDSGGFFIAILRKKLNKEPRILETDAQINQKIPLYQWNKPGAPLLVREISIGLNDSAFTDKYQKLHDFFGFKENISHLLYCHSTKGKLIYISNESVNNILRHNGSVISSEDEQTKKKFYHRMYDVVYFGSVIFKRDDLKINPMEYRLCQTGIQYLLPYLSDKRIVTLDNYDVIKYILIRNLFNEELHDYSSVNEEIKSKVSLQEFEQLKLRIKEQKVWDRVKLFENGNIILKIRDTTEAFVCFKHNTYVEMRCMKEAEWLMRQKLEVGGERETE